MVIDHDTTKDGLVEEIPRLLIYDIISLQVMCSESKQKRFVKFLALDVISWLSHCSILCRLEGDALHTLLSIAT